MDYSLISNIRFDGIDHNDYPDYCDVSVLSAYYDGVDMTDEQIEQLNEDRGVCLRKINGIFTLNMRKKFVAVLMSGTTEQWFDTEGEA
jgi:hypothetical protein